MGMNQAHNEPTEMKNTAGSLTACPFFIFFKIILDILVILYYHVNMKIQKGGRNMKRDMYKTVAEIQGKVTELTTTKTRLQSVLYTIAGRKERATHEKIPDEQREKGLHSH